MDHRPDPLLIDSEAIALVRARYEQGQFDAAVDAAHALLERWGDHAELLNLAGACYLKLGRPGAAEGCLIRAARIDPQSADVDNNLGVAHLASGRREDAERSFRRAASKSPGHGEAWLNLGMLLRADHRLIEAEQAIRRAVEHTPGNHEVLNAFGLVLKDLYRYDEAEAAYRQAVALQPGSAVYRLNLGNVLLSRDNWIEGLPLFEARHEPGFDGVFSSAPPVAFPQWRGEPIEGASLLIWPEQGHGDQIQLARYVKRIRECGAKRITLVCSAATRALFAALSDVDAMVAIVDRETFDPSACPAHDFWTYLWSIPLNLKDTLASVPAELPYLHVPRNAASKWERLMPKGRMRVGVVWKGNPGNANDHVRSLPGLKTLEPLWQIEGLTFVSLQKEATGADLRSEIGDRFIVNLGNRVVDFSDVAAIVSRLDLVIGVDTAAVHLSAALGKPTWILLSNVATDWRWTGTGTTSVWYPRAVTLFRQRVDETDWSGVVGRVASELLAMSSKN